VDYTDPQLPLAYWRSTSNYEVDFILADATAVEAKQRIRSANAISGAFARFRKRSC
jgi:hypothetical protein